MHINNQALNRVDQDKRLSDGAKQLAHHLARLTGRKVEWLKISHAKLAMILDRSISTVKRRLAELIGAGYLVSRCNAVTIAGFKFKIASSYRFVTEGLPAMKRKPVSFFDWRHAAAKARRRIALSLTREPCEGDRYIPTNESPAFCRQSALEAMLQDRRDRLLKRER